MNKMIYLLIVGMLIIQPVHSLTIPSHSTYEDNSSPSSGGMNLRDVSPGEKWFGLFLSIGMMVGGNMLTKDTPEWNDPIGGYIRGMGVLFCAWSFVLFSYDYEPPEEINIEKKNEEKS